MIIDLNKRMMHDIVVEYESRQFSYAGDDSLDVLQMCANFEERFAFIFSISLLLLFSCFSVAGEYGPLPLLRQRNSNLLRSLGVTVGYPQVRLDRFPPVYMALSYGGIEPKDGSTIRSVRYVRLLYVFKTGNETNTRDNATIDFEQVALRMENEVF